MKRRIFMGKSDLKMTKLTQSVFLDKLAPFPQKN